MAIRLTVMMFHIQTTVVDPRTEIALSTATGMYNKLQHFVGYHIILEDANTAVALGIMPVWNHCSTARLKIPNSSIFILETTDLLHVNSPAKRDKIQ